MNPRRFIVLFALASVLSVSSSLFFVFVARVLGDVRVVYISVVITILLTFVFGWLYFRGTQGAPWRSRAEAIAVWMLLTFAIDMGLLYGLFDASITDLGRLSLIGYVLQTSTLVAAAAITRRDLALKSPDLKITP